MRRKPTLPFASAFGEPPTVSITSEDWHEIESALGPRLPKAIREKLSDATNMFLNFVVFEASVEPLEGAEVRLKKLKQTSGALWRALHTNTSGDAAVYADHLIEVNFMDVRIGPQRKLNSFSGLVGSFGVACDRAIKNLKSGNRAEIIAGEYWDGWIRRVAAILDSYGVPVTVRKDSDKSKTPTPSPFVLFVKRLQKCFAEEYRRGAHSDVALANAIVKARRVAKRQAEAV